MTELLSFFCNAHASNVVYDECPSYVMLAHLLLQIVQAQKALCCLYSFASSMPTTGMHCDWQDKIAVRDQYTCVVQGYVRIGFRIV